MLKLALLVSAVTFATPTALNRTPTGEARPAQPLNCAACYDVIEPWGAQHTFSARAGASMSLLASCDVFNPCHSGWYAHYCNEFHWPCDSPASTGAADRALLALLDGDIQKAVGEILAYDRRLTYVAERQALQITDCEGAVLASFGPFPTLGLAMAVYRRPGVSGMKFASARRTDLYCWTL
jgi:hypothetical protein